MVERVEAMVVERAKRMARGNELEEVEVGAVIMLGWIGGMNGWGERNGGVGMG